MSEPVAIVGMACRYPDAGSPAELWQTVLAGRRAFRRLPPERLRLEDYAARAPDDADSIGPIEAAVLEDYAFDRSRFRVPVAAMRSADLCHWLALEVASDALDDAGIVQVGVDRARIAVVVGNTLTGEFSRAGLMRLRWPYVRRQLDAVLVEQGMEAPGRAELLGRFEQAYKSPFPAPDEETLAGGLSNTIAGRICNHHDLGGGGYAVDGACASSLLAVATACRHLVDGTADAVLAGGVDLSIDPFELVGFARNGALSRTLMRVFDVRSDGFWPGEGCGFVVLMRAADAATLRLRAPALIRGWGVSTDGAGGLTRPTVAGQRRALERAYARAGFGAGSVPLFEAHGTGTAVGDPVEVAAIAAARRASGIEVPAVVGSIKANIGHTKAAAGLAGLIKAVMALDQQVLPAATGCEQVDPAIAAECDAVAVPFETSRWPAGWPLRAGVSGMGFGGINVHLALEAPPTERGSGLTAEQRLLARTPQDCELVLFAAADRAGLRRSLQRMAALAPTLSRAELADAAAASLPDDDALPERACVVAATPAELEGRLERLLQRLDQAPDRLIAFNDGIAIGTAASAPRIAFLFPGQAAPTYLDGGVWRRRFTDVGELYGRAGLACLGDAAATEIAQPAIIAASVAGLMLMQRCGVHASVALGHSLGELAALHWAGAFDQAAVLRLAAGRGRAMAALSLPGGAMAMIGGADAEIVPLLDGIDAAIACCNAPRETVVTGERQAIELVLRRAAASGLTAQRLSVSHAFHSRFVAPSEAAVGRLVGAERPAPLRRTVVSSVTGARLAAGTDLVALLSSQVTAPVRFADALAAVVEDADLLIEVGPGHGLTRLARAGDVPAIALDAGGESLGGLLLAVGAGFVLGAPVRPAALFADRFTRPFDLTRPRRFLANPCESAPHTNQPDRQLFSSSTKQDVDGRPEPAMTGGSPIETMRLLLARRLEVDPVTIDAGDRLLADLHLNSIAVGQLVGEAARMLGLSPPATPTNFAAATVQEAADALGLCAAMPTDPVAEAFPPGVESWARLFETELIERPPGPAAAGSPTAWQVFGAAGHPLQQRFRDGDGDAIAICVPEHPDRGCLAALLRGAQAALRCRGPVLVLQSGGGGGGLARCLALEQPSLRVRLIDLPFHHPDAWRWIEAEAADPSPGFREAHYDAQGMRRVPVLHPVRFSGEPASAARHGDDVVAISGGARGIAAECALVLARRGARIGLIGRSAPDAPEVRATLDRLHAVGAKAEYARADVTEAGATRAAVSAIADRLGPVTALLHAAGLNQPTALAQLDAATLTATVSVKVDGLRNLLDAVDADRLRTVIAFSSIIAAVGLPGELHYALANEWMEAALDQFAAAHPTCRCMAPRWSVWSGVGMGERLGVVESLARHGVVPLSVDKATALFARLIDQPPPARRCIVASRFGAPPTVELALPTERGRFVEDVRVFYPGIEIVADASLSAASDPYLLDHALGGDALLPAVMGLEAMAQAAESLTGLRPASFGNVEWRRPVRVTSGGARIRIAALGDDDGASRLVLRAEETGFQFDHFRADAGGRPVAIDPIHRLPPLRQTVLAAEDIYGPLLFHTGRFRRITGYDHLSAGAVVARLHPSGSEPWFADRAPGDLTLGDAAARDAALHALQACIPHRRVLPVGVGRIVPSRLDPAEAYTVRAWETERGSDRFTFDLEIVRQDGTTVEQWRDLRLQAIETLRAPARWPPALAACLIERRVGELLPDAAIRVALAEFAGDPRAGSSEAMMRSLLPEGETVRRRADGKPEAVSFVTSSHAGGLVLAAAAPAAVGCDLEPVIERTETTWRELLGLDGHALAGLVAARLGETFGSAACRVWTAREAMEKAGIAVAQAPLTFERSDDAWCVLRSGGFAVVSWVGRVAEANCAVAVGVSRPADGAARAAAPVGRACLSSSRREAPAYSYRHVVGLSDTNVVGNVYFSNHIEWQGRCREMFLRDKAPSVLEQLGKDLSLLTTHCSCEYLHELEAFDEVRLDMRLDEVAGNRIVFSFDYWRCNRGSEELVAVGKQEVVCRQTGSDGEVPAEVPAPLLAALRAYRPGVVLPPS